MTLIPDTFAHTMKALHGDEGVAWLERLPSILLACERRWHITVQGPFANLSFHYVARAIRADGTPVVIKACSPTNEFVQEAEALRLFGGRGMVQLRASDADDEVMLLEYLHPGTPLLAIEDDELATSIAADVMSQFWCPAPAQHPFPTVQDWGRGFTRLHQHYEDGYGPFPRKLLDEAEALYAELSASMTMPMLLHGDLHHENILAATRAPWLAIDPKGLIGEPAYEVGAWLRNPLPQLLQMPHPGRVLARRMDQFVGLLCLDHARVRGWALAQAMLSAWWSVEDFGEISREMLTCVELLAAIKP